MIDNNGGGGIPQNGYNHNPNAQFRGTNDINAGGINHHSARPNSLGSAANQYQQINGGGGNMNFQSFNGGNNEANYKFASAGVNQNGAPQMQYLGPNNLNGQLSGDRPMSRGNNGPSAKLSAQQAQNIQQQPNMQIIHQDQQNFHLPPGSFQPGQPTVIGGGPGQPQFHFIANKQKFYAQITPDKAPMIFNSDKRPFTAANPVNGLQSNGIQQNPGSQTTGKRGNSHNGKQRGGNQDPLGQQPQLQQINHLTTSGIQPPSQLYQNPYHLQLASKTHSGAFGAQGLQQMMINPMGANTMTKFGVASTAQLETHTSSQAGSNSSTQAPGNQLVSIFNPSGQGKQLKVKPPNRNNIKEKEQLYEDAIKLKIQVNSYREENVRLKTKIKILENDMTKQERAMEEFIAKFQSGGSAGAAAHLLSSPLIGSASTGSQQSASSQQQNGVNNTNLNIKGLDSSVANNNHMISIMSQVSSSIKPFLQQNETFLVISLKKQLKELKADSQKKEEELENFRKSIKNTRQVEIDTEIKTYIDECQRLRQLLQTMLEQGPHHPLYQERLQHLEQQRQSNEFLIAQLTQQNQELMRAVAMKDEEIGAKQGARKELKQELVKARKMLREREKEITKLKVEVSQKKANGLVFPPPPENNSFSTKEANVDKTAAKSTEQVPSSAPSDKDSIQAQQAQLKSLQKKVRDLTNDTRAKKSHIEVQEQSIKQLQENLKTKESELTAEHKKIKILEDDLAKAKKSLIQENDLKNKFGKEIEIIQLTARREKISLQEIAKKLKEDGGVSLLKGVYDIPTPLKEFFLQSSIESISRLIPHYVLLSDDLTSLLTQDAFSTLKRVKNLKDKYETSAAETETFEKFNDYLKSQSDARGQVTSDHLDLIKVKHFEVKVSSKNAPGGKTPVKEVTLMINMKKLLADLSNAPTTVVPPSSFQTLEKEQASVKSLGAKGAALTKTPLSIKKTPSKPVPTKAEERSQKKATVIVADIEDDESEEENKKGQESYEEDFDKDQKAGTPAKKAASEKKDSSAKKRGEEEENKKDDKDPGKYMDEEEMLDVAEHCFIKMAETLIEKGRTARSIFTKYSIPEQFPDGTILELLSPIGFLEGVKEASGIEDLTEMEAACLLRVLAKPELDNAIILNEFTMIMENFGVPDIFDDEAAAQAEDEDDDDFDDYVRDEDYLTNDDGPKGQQETKTEQQNPLIPEGKKLRVKPKRKKIILVFEELEAKGHKILRKLARFLLERYMHPREFYGPAIYRQMIKCKVKSSESHPVDILHAKDFYQRMKAAGVRKTAKEDENLNKFLQLDTKFPHLMQMKRVVKALEEIAQVEQKKMQEEMAKKAQKAAAGLDDSKIDEENEDKEEDKDLDEEESEEGDIGEDEKKAAKKIRRKKSKRKGAAGIGPSAKANMDLIREAGMGGGYMNDYFAGVGSKTGSASAQQKLALLMGGSGGFSNLNTIEEEKHETQTSNYFRDAANVTESERDYDHNHVRGSKIMENEEVHAQSLIHSSSKISPQRMIEGAFTNDIFEFPGSTKHHQKSVQQKVSRSGGEVPTPSQKDRLQLSEKHTSKKAADILVDDEVLAEGTPNKNGNPYQDDDDDDEDEEDYEEYKDVAPAEKGKRGTLAEEEEEDDYEDDQEDDDNPPKHQLKRGDKHMSDKDDEDDDEDYEF